MFLHDYVAMLNALERQRAHCDRVFHDRQARASVRAISAVERDSLGRAIDELTERRWDNDDDNVITTIVVRSASSSMSAA